MYYIRSNNNSTNVGMNSVIKSSNPKFESKKKVSIIPKKDLSMEEKDIEMK